ncbi:16S rRNA (guanine(966)-N(2))-methyltransferase RsmD [Niveibacterium sp. SC-1]|uniref:16S rRNA (guanine(966)-N(2))-methyltransferase RsmD n=1 Tax=Niveibacterium sp. SC-1 TaxID=3135646 RepID=UPI00311F75DB
MSQLRIVGGQWRSRRLRVAEVPGLRPTPDRVRETLFNWLGQDLDGWACLDLFAGSGALGFEAASRGAAQVVLLERDPRAFAQLQQNADLLGGEALHCRKGDAEQYLRATGDRFDVIFLDPPFRQDWLARVEPLLPRVMAAGGCVYVEAESEVPELAGLRAVKTAKAGQVHYQLLRAEQG